MSTRMKALKKAYKKRQLATTEWSESDAHCGELLKMVEELEAQLHERTITSGGRIKELEAQVEQYEKNMCGGFVGLGGHKDCASVRFKRTIRELQAQLDLVRDSGLITLEDFKAAIGEDE